MSYVKSTWMLLSLLLLVGCAGKVKVSDIPFHAPIPFIDGEEAAYVNIVSGETGIIGTEQWNEMRPRMFMITIDDADKLLQDMYYNCRWAGDECTEKVRSIESGVRKLDSIIEKVLTLKKKIKE